MSTAYGSASTSVVAMLTRGLQVLLVVLLVAVTGSVMRSDVADDASLSGQSDRRRADCHGLKHAQVRGAKPTYTRKKLANFPNHKIQCHGVWLPEPRRYFVPQGLAISGNSAWVSGFRYREGYGKRPCQLMRVNLLTGRRLASHSAIYGQVGKRPRTYCRHGGGIMQRGRWLWIVESSKLWLVDPSRRGSVLNARRAWRIEAPVRGSAIVATAHRIGLVPFQTRGAPRIYWFDIKSLIKPGVLDLATRSAGRSQLGAVRSTRVPRLVQGATLDAYGRLYLSRSNLSCGELVTPFGRRIAFIPGAEGIQFAARGRRLWSVSESGSWPYSRSRKPLTPGVSSFEWPRLVNGKRAGCFAPY
jgi:hypothetical protein